MTKLEQLLWLAGCAHFGILIASALVPKVCRWDVHLKTLPKFLETLFWVYGIFIVLVIIGFGTLTLLFASEIATGITPARGLAAFIAVFWLCRLVVQLFVFDLSKFLTTPLLRAGYRFLTLVFASLVLVYGWAALFPVTKEVI
jgi:hypothetical protein